MPVCIRLRQWQVSQVQTGSGSCKNCSDEEHLPRGRGGGSGRRGGVCVWGGSTCMAEQNDPVSSSSSSSENPVGL